MADTHDPFEAPLPARLWVVPAVSTLIGSALSLLPVVAATPTMPPFGLLVALAWRLWRPELWPAWMALPLGLADDLIGGAALGQAMTLWTIAFLGIDAADHLPSWRDYWHDWGVASGAILFCCSGAWAFACFTGGGGGWWLMLPQIALAILAFPAVARLIGALDAWRLKR